MKVLFIYNPRAGKERIRSNLLDIIDIFTKAGWEVTAYPTQGEGDAVQRVIGASEEYELICVSGGDGTLDEVVNGMMNRGKRCPIGFVPAGSTNDFAMSLGIPSGMKAAAQAIVGGEREAFDIGSLNGDAFTYVAAFGLFTEVSYETNQDMKNLFGHAAYVMEGAKKLSEIRSYAMRIRGDEFSLKGKFLYGMITNSVSVGGFKGITGDHVDLQDGLFEVTLVEEPGDMVEYGGILAALMNRGITSPFVHCFKTSELIVDSKLPVSWTRDGEFGGSFTHVELYNHQQELELLLPKNWKEKATRS